MNRYQFSQVIKAIQNPRMVRGELNYVGERLNVFIHSLINTNDGIDVLDEDWDNLIILDACRFDDFVSQSPFKQPAEKRISKGCNSIEFLQRNFSGSHHDIVYVTANPHVMTHGGEFHRTISLLDEGWDNDFNTVMPQTVTEAAFNAIENFPDKRLVVHFMQPHLPAIGEMFEELPGKDFQPTGENEADGGLPTWSSLRYGMNGVTLNKVRKAYLENLDIVLPYAKEVAEGVPGKSVITSDHGELFGRRLWPIPVKGFMHMARVRMPELIKVPWLEIDDTRREIIKEPPLNANASPSEVDERQLKALGYM